MGESLSQMADEKNLHFNLPRKRFLNDLPFTDKTTETCGFLLHTSTSCNKDMSLAPDFDLFNLA